ncbi:MAG: lamin tail domain-containing protein [Patescibacteria group bacterium]
MKKIIVLAVLMIILIPFITAEAEPAVHLVISEIKTTGGSGKSTDEFVELYNPTETDVSMSGWRLIKKTASGSEYPLVDDFGDKAVKAHSFFLVAHPVGYLGEAAPDFYYTSTNSLADNNTVVLIDNNNQAADKVGFGSAVDFEGVAVGNPGANKSVERKARADSTEETMSEGGPHYFLGNSEETDNNAQDFISRSVAEPQNSSSELEYLDIEIPEIPEEPADNNSNTNSQNSNANKAVVYSDKIIITEIFPNPEGADDGEFIELFNNGNQAVDLSGWQVSDETSRHFIIKSEDFENTVIGSGGYFLIKKEISGISLNNTGDAAKIYQPNGNLLNSVEYTGCQENKSFSLINSQWVWTDELTPGRENKLAIENTLPEAQFELEKGDYKVGQKIAFDASESSDADGDELEYFWEFGDEGSAEGVKAEHSYIKAGEYTARLLVRDSKDGESELEQKISITDYEYSGRIILNELLPACSPTDAECEFVELFNEDSRDINLAGWQVTDLKKYFTFSDKDIIKAGGFLIIKRQDSKITLNNDKDTVYLIDPRGKIINGVEFTKAKKDFSFSFDFDSGRWQWTEKSTPGEENEIISNEEVEAQSLLEEDKNINGETVVLNSSPIEMPIGEIKEDSLGKILKITGEVESANSRGIYLMDELGNILRVYIQAKTGIPQPEVSPGDTMTVVGLLDKTTAGLRLLPRTAGDITVEKKKTEGEVLGASTESEKIDIPVDDKSRQIRLYLIIAGAAVVVLIAGLAVKRFINKKDSDKEAALD